METIVQKLGVVQNIGIVDRMVRVVIATALISIPAYVLSMTDAVFSLGLGIAILLSVYPALTAILGWDPFYSTVSVRTCGNTGWNQCGTLPYEVDAALGHQPVPNNDYDHSLAGSHH
jgi:hypothetical protein